MSLLRAAVILAAVPGALIAQVPEVRPNDPLFRDQIALYADSGTYVVARRSTRAGADTFHVAPGVTLDLPRAWAISTGSAQVVVAVLDDGFFYRHEDIASNVWHNPGETGVDRAGLRKETNGVDDDGNGYVDDVIGWDFAFDDPEPDPYVFDGMDRNRIQPYWHSISALGIIGAEGNNGIGVAGINWRVSLMLLKIGAQGRRTGADDSARVRRAAQAIRYAVDNGARVINWSGYVTPADTAELAPLRDAVSYADARGVLLVTGAGNDGKDLDDDRNCLYPQCFDFANQVRVAQVAFDGTLYHYTVGGQRRGSNYGARRVEIGAIGEEFTTGLLNGRSMYEQSTGTSSAGPVVAGVAALILAVRPELSAVQLRDILLRSATPLPGLRGKLRSAGVVNAYRALRLALSS
jgi:subtilisin family serine protease